MNIERGHTVNIKEAFREMLDDYNIDSKYKATIIKRVWGSVMGKTVASRTRKVSYNKKKLIIKVDSAPLRNELNMSRSKVLLMFEKELGEGVVEEVKFT